MSYKQLLLIFVIALSSYSGSQFFGLSHDISITLSITVVTAYLWISEVIPIPVASLVPLFSLPLSGVLSHKQAASALGSHVIILLMGAFMLAKGIAKSGVHERIALGMIRILGGNDSFRIILAFMLTASFLSMWISNTATVLALLPIAMTIAQHSNSARFATVLLLGLAYSASLGGAGTLIGTPPNVIFASVYEEFKGQEFIFLDWMKIGVPIVLISIPLMALWLSRGIKLTEQIVLPTVSKVRTEERRVLTIFAIIVILWITRTAPFGGWSQWLGLTKIGDSSIALFGVFLMFITASGNKDKKDRLLDWAHAKAIPWDMLLLFASGICLAKGFVASGLSDLIGAGFVALTELPTIVILLLMTLSVTFLTEVTSNTATATLLMPILASAAMQSGLPLELLMIPAAISCSCAFCLPVATAPNSIVFAEGQVTIKEMAREGMVLNVLVALVVTMVCYVMLY